MNNKELTELKKDFDDRVIGETFAGGIFNDNDNQRMYTSGYADGFKSAKSISWRWFEPHLSNKSEVEKEAVEGYDLKTMARIISKVRNLPYLGDNRSIITLLIDDLTKEYGEITGINLPKRKTMNNTTKNTMQRRGRVI